MQFFGHTKKSDLMSNSVATLGQPVSLLEVLLTYVVDFLIISNAKILGQVEISAILFEEQRIGEATHRLF